MSDDRMLEEAINAIKDGHKPRAKELLSRLLRSDQNNIEYWLYMSAVVETEKEKIYCLKNAQKIDADNEIVRRGLIYFGEQPPDSNQVFTRPVKTREWDVAKVIQTSVAKSKSKKGRPKLTSTRIASFAIFGVVGLAIVLFAVYNGTRLFTPDIEITRRELVTIGPSATKLPTATPLGAISSPTSVTSIILGEIHNMVFTPTAPIVPPPTDSNEALQTAMRHFLNGFYQQALPLFKQYIDAFPENVDVRYYYAMTYYRMEEYQKSIDEFEKIININDQYGPGYLGLSQAWLALIPDSTVGEELTYAITYMPDVVDGYLVRGVFFINKENPEAAIVDAEKALEIDPTIAIAHQILAEAYLLLGDYEAALEPARISIETNPTIIENYLPFAKILVESNIFDEAEEPLKAYLSMFEEDADAWFYLGRVEQALGNHEDALVIFENVLLLQDDYFITTYYRGISYLALEDYQNATIRFENTYRIYPDWFEAGLFYAQALYLKTEIADANIILENISALAKTNFQFAQLYYWRAQTFELLDFPDLADRDWQLLLDLPFNDVPPDWSQTATLYLSGLSATETPSPTLPPTRTPFPSKTPTPTPVP